MAPRTPAPRPSLKTETVTIADLEQGDRIVPGTVVGSFVVSDVVSVKMVNPADNGKFAVTFYNQGTLFLHGALLVSVVAEDD